MQQGTVKFFNESKGFGFIIPDSGEKEIFVHISGVVGQIREKDKVTYEVKNGTRGLSAVNVTIL